MLYELQLIMSTDNTASLRPYWDILHEIALTVRDRKSTLTTEADLWKEIAGCVLQRFWSDTKLVWTNYGCFNEIYMETRSEFRILTIAKQKARKVKEARRMAVSAVNEAI